VETSNGIVNVRTSNVGCFSFDVAQLELEEPQRLDIDGYTLTIPDGVSANGSRLYLQRESGTWRVSGLPIVPLNRVSLRRFAP
jgi:hypothetical protein